MESPYKPEAYNSVSPYLIVSGASATIDFLVRVFGAVELLRFAGEDDKVRHAEVRIDDSVIMLADEVDGWPPTTSNVHVYVKDVDAVYRRALDAGATSIQEPIKRDDPHRRAGVKDVGGTVWWISTTIG